MSTELASVVYQSFYEFESQRHLIDIYFCEQFTDDEDTVSRLGTLEFSYNGKHPINHY